MRSPERKLQRHYFFMMLFIIFFSACSTGPSSRPVTTNKTAVIAGGEPVLAHSQIHFHDAPLPTPADLHFNDWTLSGHDNASTRSVALPSCCTAQTPVPLWFHSFGTPLLDAPVIENEHIYLLASDGYLYVLDVRSGEEQWRIAVGGELTGLALAHGMIFLALAGHFIAALDANTGQERWRFDTVGVVRAAPTVVGRVLLVASGSNSLFCLDALTGEEYWAFHSEDALAEFWPTRTNPVVAGGLVYVALGAANEFNALDLRTGRKVWEVALHERMTGGPVLDEALGLVYIVTWSGRVVAIDSHSGRIGWDTRISGGSESSPALSLRAGLLFAGSYDGYLYAFDASSGKLRWRTQLGSAVTASPLVVQAASQDWVIAASQAGSCVILDAHSGKQLDAWRLGELRAAPVVAQGTLYQASLGDRGLFAIGL
jgi:eukaryotic-like serine/threonine-protein kinase